MIMPVMPPVVDISDIDLKRPGVYQVRATISNIEKMLALNTNNRNISKRNIQLLVSSMVNGVYHPEAGVLLFSDEPRLIDGQHRLLAMKHTIDVHGAIFNGATFLARFGLPAEIYDYVDQGKKRNAADMIHQKNAPSVAAVSRIALWLDSGAAIQKCAARNAYAAKSAYYSDAAVHKYADEHEDELQWCVREGSRLHDAIGVGAPARHMFAVMILGRLHGREQVDAFTTEMVSGNDPSCISGKSSILQHKVSSGNIEGDYLVGALFQAFNAWRMKKVIKSTTQWRKWLDKYEELYRARGQMSLDE